jgi:TolB-like protein/DNA-binding winged helix-turn-helix (wHTH) protein
MDGSDAGEIVRFEGFRFDRAGGCLYRRSGAGVGEPVALGSRALALLAVLVARQGQLVSKDEIMRAVWPGIAVEEANLTVQVSALRRVLDRDRERGSCIQTVSGRGYRFAAVVEPDERVALNAEFDADRRGAAAGLAKAESPPAAVPAEGLPAPVPPKTGHRSRFRARAIILGGLFVGAAVFSASRPTVLSLGNARSTPRLSIVVLPFANLGTDPNQQYLAEALTADLTVDLSRIEHMFVISGRTAFTYRNRAVSAKQIGRELGVRYVLEGSVQRSGKTTRVGARLVDAERDANLWAERYDRANADLFALQDEIAGRIAHTLRGPMLAVAEVAWPAENPVAVDAGESAGSRYTPAMTTLLVEGGDFVPTDMRPAPLPMVTR